MNIITITYNSNFFYIRGDISLNKDSNDYFCPDGIEKITVAPFLYIKIDRAGKAIQSKFARRYYSKIGYGVNITAESLIKDGIPESFLMANTLDNTTVVSELFAPDSLPLEKIAKMQGVDNIAGSLLDMPVEKILELFDNKLQEVSVYSSVKTGDYIAIEFAPRTAAGLGSAISLGEISFKIK